MNEPRTLLKQFSAPKGRVLIESEQIRERMKVLGSEVTSYYSEKHPVFVGLMNGSLFFLTDLIRNVSLDFEVHCVRVNSYVGSSSGMLRGMESIDDIREEIRGRNVLVVDDIFDTGQTLAATMLRLRNLGADEVKSCVLLEKDRSRLISIRPDWVGFHIADEFVIGYGLDYNGRFRGLDHIRVLDVAET